MHLDNAPRAHELQNRSEIEHRLCRHPRELAGGEAFHLQARSYLAREITGRIACMYILVCSQLLLKNSHFLKERRYGNMV